MDTVQVSLMIMLKGMIGIFAVILVIFAAIAIFNRVFKAKK